MDVTNYPPDTCTDCIHYAACPCQWSLHCAACLTIAVYTNKDGANEANIYLQDHRQERKP